MIKYFLRFVCLFLFIAQAKSQSTTVTFTTNADAGGEVDAYVHSLPADTNTNFGSDGRNIAIRWTSSSVPFSTRAYLKFDVSSIPSSAHVCSAYLTFYTTADNNQAGYNQSNVGYLKRVTSAWTYTTVTWHNQPTFSSTDTVRVGPVATSTVAYIADVTTQVQNMVTTPSTNYGWVLALKNEVNYYNALSFASSNNSNTGLRPQLTITYAPTITATTPAARCSTGIVTLGATTNAGTINWYAAATGGSSLGTGTSFTTPSISSSTTYYVASTYSSCTTPTRTAIIATVNSLPILSISPSATICAGTATTLTVSGASTYTWSPGTGLSPTTGSTTSASPSSNTNYTVTGTSSSGCVNTKTVSVAVNPLPTLTVSPSSPSICKGSSTTFTASGASTYTWTPNTALTCSVCASPVASPTTTTNYTVTGTNSNGCINTKAVTLTVNPVPSLTVNSPDTIYGSQTATLTASGASTYSWTPATGLSATTGSTVIASPTVTTIYTVIGTGANTCTANATANVVNLNLYFRSAQTGNWSTNTTWQSSPDNTTWSAATLTPTYKSRTVTIQTGHKVTIASSVEIDETVVNGSLIYGNNVGNNLTINDGTGTDLTINGSFKHNSPDSVIWLSSSTWSLGSNDTLVINTNTTGQGWRTNYAGGISSIPASANWAINKTSTVNPTLYSNTGMYYPNLIIQNNTGTTWVTSISSSFVGSATPPIIKGNLSIGGSGTGNISFLDTNTNATRVLVNGNLTINTGSILRSHATGFEVQGNLVLNGTIDYGTNNATMVFSGTGNQTISGSSLSFKNITLNKSSVAATVTLISPASIAGSMTFTKGIIVTDTVNVLNFLAGSTVNGANNDSSFVSGPVKKTGNTAFTFPLGKHTNAQTIAITAPSNSTDVFQAEYFDTDATATYGTNTDVTFDYVSTCEFFKLQRKNGTSNVQPTLSYDFSSCFANLVPAPRVIGFDGSKWKDLGSANLTYSAYGGAISTASVVTQYGPITLGNNDTGLDSIMGEMTPPIDYNNDPPSNAYLYYKNSGQILHTNGTPDDTVKFYTEFTYPKLFFGNKNISFLFGKSTQLTDSTIADSLHRIDLSFVGSNTNANIAYFDPTSVVYNYMYGYANGGAGINGVKGNRGLIVKNIYNSIDLQVYSNHDGLKYYFVVKPGGKPSSIQHFFNGAVSSSISGGNLTINAAFDSYTFNAPVAYQVDTAGNSTVMSWSANWVNIGTNKYNFNVGAYNIYEPLIFEVTRVASVTSSSGDPYWSTCIPGTLDDASRALAYDPASQTIFMAGETSSVLTGGSGNLPLGLTSYGYNHTKSTGIDGYILAFNSTGSILWGTYLGGTGSDYIHDIEYSSANGGRLYVVGETFSGGDSTSGTNYFPHKKLAGAYYQYHASATISPIMGTGFIARFNTGTSISLLGQPDWISFFGCIFGQITGIDEDATTHDIYIVGTQGQDPPSQSSCAGVAYKFPLCDPGSPAYAKGFYAGDYNALWSDGFISKFDQSGVLGWSTFVGGALDDQLTDVTVDAANHFVYATGNTYSTPGSTNCTGTFPICGGTGAYADKTATSNATDAFITKFSTTDFSLQWLTLLGGAGSDYGRQIEVNSSGEVFVVGTTSNTSPNACSSAANTASFPICASGAEYSETPPVTPDNFITKFDVNNTPVWSTWFGGGADFQPFAPWKGSPAIAFDNSTNDVYICGTTYVTSAPYAASTSAPDYTQMTNSQSGGGSNAILFAIDPTNSLSWGTFFGGNGYKTLSNLGVNYKVGDAGIDVLAANGNVFLTGLSYASTTSLPDTHPPSSTSTYYEPHSTGANSDAFITEFNSTIGVGIKNFTPIGKLGQYSLFPNPTNGAVTIKGLFSPNSNIQVLNSLGQSVYSAKQNTSTNEVSLDLSSLGSGMYLINIMSGNTFESQKLVIFR